MDRTVVVEVAWDDEADVWIAASETIGLFTEAATLDEIRRKVPLIASDLLEEDHPEHLRLHVQLLVKFDEVVPAAA